MEHDQLLIAMCWVVEGIKVERQVPGWSVERLDEQAHQHTPQPPQVGDRHRVLESRQRGLTGEIGIVGEAVVDQLEDGVRSLGMVDPEN
jgi:hypothetical protein